MSTHARRAPSLFICHGGGPMPLLGEPSQQEIVRKLKEHVAQLFSGDRRPSAIVLVSAHYETSRVVRVGGAAAPKMLYDYGGFPAESYKLQYPAPGSPDLAKRIVDLLKGANIPAEVEPNRAFDHGVFVPLMVMFPDASIPVVPLSVLQSQGATEHIKIGRALASLRDENILILGSGSSSHNFATFGRGNGVGAKFNDHLTKIIEDKSLPRDARAEALEGYLKFPGAEEAQTRGAAEHLMPLFTVLGAAGGNEWGTEVGNCAMANWNVRHWLFDAAADDGKNKRASAAASGDL